MLVRMVRRGDAVIYYPFFCDAENFGLNPYFTSGLQAPGIGDGVGVGVDHGVGPGVGDVVPRCVCVFLG